MQHIIVAPHADDEIIGCWELLSDREKDCRVYFIDAPTNTERQMFRAQFPHVHIVGIPWINPDEVRADIERMTRSSTMRWYFPDPASELHPMHKYWGDVGAGLFRSGILPSVCFYTTNMNTPYVREVMNWESKRDALNTIYPNKADLWRYDHRWFLFEGRCQWL